MTAEYHNKYLIRKTFSSFFLPALMVLSSGSALAINNEPTPTDDTMIAIRGMVTATLDGGVTSVLDNDTDPDGDNLFVNSVQVQPSKGALTLNADGTFTYVHDNSFNLADRFTYRVCDDGDPVKCTSTGTNAKVDIAIDLGNAAICSDPNVAIPDGDPITGITDAINVLDTGNIGDLNVVVLVDHSWAGDLSFTLVHDGVDVMLLDRPGVPGIDEFGCGEANVDAVFDDEAGTLAEDTCSSNDPAIFDSVIPNQFLSGFDDQDFSGLWSLTVTDAVAEDVGALLRWCLIPTIGDVINTPPIAVDDTMTAIRGQVTTVLDSAITTVLANDSDAEGDNLMVLTVPVLSPRHGSLTLNADGTFSYNHDGSFTLTDTFIYRVCDDGAPVECSDGTVTISVDPGAGSYCSTPNAAIPDGSAGISDTISITDIGDLEDMDVVVFIEHVFVGDLLVSLTHDNGTSVALLDRPGTIDPANDFGCDGDDVDAVFDDDAGTAAEGVCDGAIPTIDGTFSPTGSLVDFVAESITGDWRLDVEDAQADDPGTFRRWCLIPTVGIPPNTAPDAIDDAIAVAKGGTATQLVGDALSVLDNDTDGEGDNMTVNTTPLLAPTHGAIDLNADGTFSYLHDNSYTTSDFFIYQVCDDGSPVECSQANVTIDIDLGIDPLCNRPIVAIPDGDSFTGITDSILFLNHGAVADVNLLLHIDHTFVGDLRAVLTHGVSEVILLERPGEPADPAGCSRDNVEAVFDDEASIPAEDQCSNDDPVIFGPVTPTQSLGGFDAGNVEGGWSLTVYDVASGDTGTLVQWCVLPVIEANRAPTADNQGVATPEDIALPITLTGNDLDFDSLMYAIQDSPVNGSLSGIPPNVTYTPDDNFFGDDSFTFTTFDGALSSAQATINISVNSSNDPPVANSDVAATNEDTTVDIVLTGSDVDGDPFTFNILTAPANGSLSGTSPNISYTPDTDFNGADSLQFETHDGALASDPATISITVTAVNDEPSVVLIGDLEVSEDAAPQSIPGFATPSAGGGSDEAGQTFSFSVSNNNNSLFNLQPVLDVSGTLSYTPAPSAHGSTLVTVTVTDSGGIDNGGDNTNNATFTITVNPVNDPPGFTIGPNQSVDEDSGPASVPDWAIDISPGPPDEAGQIVTFNITGNTNTGLFAVSPAVSSTGELSYTPLANANGIAIITLVAQDDGGTLNPGDDDTSAAQEFSITVLPLNDLPVADDQAVSTDEEVPLDITLTATDPDEGDTLSYAIVTPPTHGNLDESLLPLVTYTPAAGYAGPDSFTFKVNDGTEDSATATVTISVGVTPDLIYSDSFEDP